MAVAGCSTSNTDIACGVTSCMQKQTGSGPPNPTAYQEGPNMLWHSSVDTQWKKSYMLLDEVGLVILSTTQ